MAGISSSSVDAAPHASPPAPPAAEGHNDTFSPLVDLLERFPDLFKQKVLQHLDPIDRTFLAQAGGACRAAVAASDLPRAGTKHRLPGRSVWIVYHQLWSFCTSVERLAWAKDNGCLWDEMTCALAAKGSPLTGRLEVLQWARAHDCPWDARTCSYAAYAGHLEVLRWAREHGQGLTLVHYSPQRQHFLRDTMGTYCDEMAQAEPKSGQV